MAFNFKKSGINKDELANSIARLENRERRVDPEKLFIIYVMPNYTLMEGHCFPFNIRVWSRIDQRYIYNTYVKNADIGRDTALKEYKKGKSIVIDIRTETKTSIEQKYRMRFY